MASLASFASLPQEKAEELTPSLQNALRRLGAQWPRPENAFATSFITQSERVYDHLLSAWPDKIGPEDSLRLLSADIAHHSRPLVEQVGQKSFGLSLSNQAQSEQDLFPVLLLYDLSEGSRVSVSEETQSQRPERALWVGFAPLQEEEIEALQTHQKNRDVAPPVPEEIQNLQAWQRSFMHTLALAQADAALSMEAQTSLLGLLKQGRQFQSAVLFQTKATGTKTRAALNKETEMMKTSIVKQLSNTLLPETVRAALRLSLKELDKASGTQPVAWRPSLPVASLSLERTKNALGRTGPERADQALPRSGFLNLSVAAKRSSHRTATKAQTPSTHGQAHQLTALLRTHVTPVVKKNAVLFSSLHKTEEQTSPARVIPSQSKTTLTPRAMKREQPGLPPKAESGVRAHQETAQTLHTVHQNKTNVHVSQKSTSSRLLPFPLPQADEISPHRAPSSSATRFTQLAPSKPKRLQIGALTHEAPAGAFIAVPSKPGQAQGPAQIVAKAENAASTTRPSLPFSAEPSATNTFRQTEEQKALAPFETRPFPRENAVPKEQARDPVLSVPPQNHEKHATVAAEKTVAPLQGAKMDKASPPPVLSVQTEEVRGPQRMLTTGNENASEKQPIQTAFRSACEGCTSRNCASCGKGGAVNRIALEAIGELPKKSAEILVRTPQHLPASKTILDSFKTNAGGCTGCVGGNCATCPRGGGANRNALNNALEKLTLR